MQLKENETGELASNISWLRPKTIRDLYNLNGTKFHKAPAIASLFFFLIMKAFLRRISSGIFQPNMYSIQIL